MGFRFKLLHTVLFLIFICAPAAAQDNYYKTVRDTIPVNFDNLYQISSVSIIPNTEVIELRGRILEKDEYSISYTLGEISLNDSVPYSIFDTLYVTYQSIRLALQREYKRRSLALRYNEQTGDTLKGVVSSEGVFDADAVFGPGIEKSGTIVRGFTVGTTKDFSLNSGLRLQLSGRLSDDIEIVAALTDENTPIQPEGNTERLEELDKVFIQLKHPNGSGTFGDYQLQRRAGEFGFIDRKLQGLLGEYSFEDHSGYVSLAGSKGKFNTNSFNGIDGVQGPYRLNGINNERDIIVIAGTEKVFLDGVEMRRGENNDYTIEYANASVTFTPKRLITSSSRIIVDFEYTDRRYARNFFGAGGTSEFWNDKIGVSFQYIREGDDQDSPIDISLSDEDKSILAAAGDDRFKAVKSGVRRAEPDSLGVIRGVYEQVDTLLNGEPFSYYVYNPGTPAAIYDVSFSFVGEGLGDYVRESLGHYRFAGRGLGGYLPVIFLPLPELKQVGNLLLNINPVEDLHISLEYSGSLWDKNRFSNADSRDDYGYARNAFIKLDPKQISLGSLDLGRAGFQYKDRFIQGRYTAPDRINEVEFGRNYNTFQNLPSADEQLREFTLNLIPSKTVSLNSMFGYLKKGEDFTSTRSNSSLIVTDNEDYSLVYNLDFVDSKNLFLRSKWVRQKGEAYYNIWKLRPGMEFLAEDRRDRTGSADSLAPGSLRYYELNPFLSLIDFEGLEIAAKYSFRDDFFPIAGILWRESRSKTQMYELKYSGLKEFNSTLNFTYRTKNYTEEFKFRGLTDNETILIRALNRFSFWKPLTGDLFYEVSTQKSARLERVFIRVQRGTGNYIYIGDLNNNGVADENEFEPALYDGDYVVYTFPTDELFPVIDLKTSTRWKINFQEMFEQNSLLWKLASPLSTETLWRVEENSRETDYKKIYLLDFSAFQNEQNTIRGSNYFQQDIFIFENDQDLSFRLRYNQRRSLNQFSGGLERGYNRERSLRIKFKMIKEVSNQTDLINTYDNLFSRTSSNRNRVINGNSVSTDFSYRPERNIEVGFRFKAGRSEDRFPIRPTIIDLNSQLIRFNLSFAGSGRLRLEVERNELTGNTGDNFLPFELTEGNRMGKNYIWRLNFDYRISNNLQSTLNYDGRILGGGKAIHTARAEVRAYF